MRKTRDLGKLGLATRPKCVHHLTAYHPAMPGRDKFGDPFAAHERIAMRLGRSDEAQGP
jgi:hypothetical protein